MSQDSDAYAETLGSGGRVPADPDRPETIGRYRILRRIGAGGMGVVYAAHDPELDRTVAVKVVRELQSDRSTLQQRLRREAQALARLTHPNVVSVYDVGVAGTHVYIVMQFVDGESLDVWLARRPPGREVLARFLDAGRGLAAAHAAGLVHRDFKPSNVLVDAAGTVRVTDFGLARIGDLADRPSEVSSSGASAVAVSTDGDTEDASITQGVVGTPAYMAPEQFERGAVTAATDQFAFCVALWEGLAGARPFTGRTLGELHRAVVDGAITPPPAGAIPRGVLRALRRGLERDPARRWPSMDALLAAIAPRRHWPWIAGAGAATVALGAGLLLARGAGDDDARCAGVTAEVDRAWTPAVRDAVGAHLASLDHRLADQLATDSVRLLGERAARWRAVRVDVCEATHVRRTAPIATHDRRVACLDASLAGLRAAVDALRAADVATLVNSTAIARSGIAADDCTADAAAALPESAKVASRELVEELAEVETLLSAGRDEAAATRGLEVARALETSGDLVLAAHAWDLVSRVSGVLPTEQAREASRHAAETATAAGNDRLAAYAWADAADVAGRASDFRAVEDLLAMARAAARRDGHPKTAAYVETQAASVALEQGDYETAIATCQKVLEQLGDAARGERPWLRAVECLADVYGRTKRWKEADEYGARLESYYTETYGAAYPFAVDARARRATARFHLGDRDGARAMWKDALAAMEATDGPDSSSVMDLLSDVAIAESEENNVSTPEARAASERALAIGKKLLPAGDLRLARLLWIHADLTANGGDLAGARPIYEDALAVYERQDDKMAWAGLAYNYADLDRIDGRCDFATPRFRRIDEMAKAGDIPMPYGAAARAGIGMCQVELGDGAATATLTAAAKDLAAAGEAMMAAQARMWIAEAAWRGGRVDEAKRIAREIATELAKDESETAKAIVKQLEEQFLATKRKPREAAKLK